MLAAAHDEIVEVAERGTRDRRTPYISEQTSARLRTSGLIVCADALPRADMTVEQAARQVLRAAYVLDAAQRELALLQALDG